MSSQSTTLPLYFCSFDSNSAFWRWHMSIDGAKWTFFVSLCASKVTSFLLLTFPKFYAGIVSSYFHSVSTAAFATGIFMTCDIGINLCTKLYYVIEVNPFPVRRSSCVLECEEFCSLPRRFVRFHNKTIHYFELICYCQSSALHSLSRC